MRFEVIDQKIQDFEEFETYLMTHFLTLDQLESFLKGPTETFLSDMVKKQEAQSSSEDDSEFRIKEVVSKFLTLFETFPSEIPTAELLTLWQSILNDLLAVSPLSALSHLIANIFGDMTFVDWDKVNLKEMEKDIRRNLKR